MTPTPLPSKQEADKLYEQYGRPLEAEHKGEYIAIVGERIVAYGKDALRVLTQAKRTSRDPLLVKVPKHDILVV